MFSLLFSVFFTLIIGISIYFYLRKPGYSEPSAIKQRYSEIILLIKQQYTNCTELATSKNIVLKSSNKKESQKYSLTEVENKLLIVWTLESELHGKRGKEWAFDNGLNQQEIFTTVANEIENYRQALYRER